MALSPFVGQRLGTLIASENSNDLDTLRALIEDGAVTPVIDRVCSLPEIPDAMRDLEAGRVRGKVVATI
jgi:NADPH:quinone reductase-like Zn-dependent oxidoreductase